MLRLTTKVTVSPASSARSSSAAWRRSSMASGPRLGEERGELVLGQALAVAPARDRAGHEIRADRARLGAPRAAARDEAPVLRLDDVEHALRDPLRVDVARVDAQALGQRHAVLRQALAHLVGRRERVLGRDVVAVGAQAAEVRGARRRRARATSRRGWAAPGRRCRASGAASRPRGASCPRSRPAWPTRAGRGAARRRGRCARSARPRRWRSRRAPRRSSGGAGRSSAGSPPAGGRARRAPRPAPRARPCGRPRTRRCRRGCRW